MDDSPLNLDFEVSQQSELGESRLSQGWKATISLAKQVMMPRLWRKLKVNQAILVLETLPPILPCFGGWTGKYLKSQKKGLGPWNYTSYKTLFEDGNIF